MTTRNRSQHQSSLTKKTTAIALVALLIVMSIPVLLYQQQDNFSGALVGAINPNPFHTDNNAEEPHSFPLTGKAVENIPQKKRLNIQSAIISSKEVNNKTINTPIDITLHSFEGKITVEGNTIFLEGNVEDISTFPK